MTAILEPDEATPDLAPAPEPHAAQQAVRGSVLECSEIETTAAS